MSIYVGNLSYEINQEDLNEVFIEYGTVKRVHIPTDRETGRVRGFAFVEMESEADEDKAIAALDGAEWMGRELQVNKARPRERNIARSGTGNTIVISGSPDSESQFEYQKVRAGSKKWNKSDGSKATKEKSSTFHKVEFSQEIEATDREFSLVLTGHLEDISDKDLKILLAQLRKLSGDSSFEILNVEQGSIIIKLRSSEDGFKAIKHLLETGQISTLIGLPVESIEYEDDETGSSKTSEDLTVSTLNSRETESDRKPSSKRTINYYDRCTVNQSNKTDLSRSVTQTKNQGNHMSENYVNNLQGASVANMANAVKDNARQQANQHFYSSEQRKTLAESASEIQHLIKQLEIANPSATENEKISYVNDETSSNFKRRLVGALKAGGEAAIEEFWDNPYANVGKAVVKGWMKP